MATTNEQKIPFVDAEEMQKKHPETFEAPSLDPECAEEIRALKAGDFVKVCALGERFWVIILKRENGKMTAMVDNYLFSAEDGLVLDYGDFVEVEDRHIYDYMDGSPTSREIAKKQGEVSE